MLGNFGMLGSPGRFGSFGMMGSHGNSPVGDGDELGACDRSASPTNLVVSDEGPLRRWRASACSDCLCHHIFGNPTVEIGRETSKSRDTRSVVVKTKPFMTTATTKD